jgi:hypothetical protein
MYSSKCSKSAERVLSKFFVEYEIAGAWLHELCIQLSV